MTELELSILTRAKEVLNDAQIRVSKMVTKCRYIRIPFICDGIIDFLIYDKEVGRFIKIKYKHDTGSDYEYRKIDL